MKKYAFKRTTACMTAAIFTAGFGINLMSFSSSPLPVTAAAISGTMVATHTQSEIIDYLDSHPYTYNGASYAEEPSTSSPYAIGTLSDETKESALNALNCVRYIAGLREVSLDDSYGELAQAGAFINAINRKLTHTPSQPSDMSDELYELCYAGASSCNLGAGFYSLTATLFGYMGENLESMGHRRWCLNPSMGKTGFGEVGIYTSMYVFDGSGSSSATGVAWPAQTMPTDYFEADDVWTYSYGESISNSSDVVVTLTRESDGETWTLSENSTTDGTLYVDNYGYGQPGCVIFQPNGIENIADGDVYHIEIDGLPEAVSYDVTFFDLDGGTTTETTTTATTDTNSTETTDITANTTTPEDKIYLDFSLIDATDDYGESYQYISFRVSGSVGQVMTLHYTVSDDAGVSYTYVTYTHGSSASMSILGTGSVTDTYELESSSTSVSIKGVDASYISDLYYTLSGDLGTETEPTTTTSTTSTTTTTTTTETITTETTTLPTETTTESATISTITTTTTTTSGFGANRLLYTVGDVTLDGAVTLSDTILLNKYCSGMVEFNEIVMLAGDCNGDGYVDSNDVLILLKFLVSLIPSIPYTE